ncbi:Thiamine diphosphokinase [Ascochyta rabiei]|uniref:Thiamine pyrophosphokinase n=1 Tax=Didymella rabiei TaxID=5454 RepID=A0A163ELX5_DIDRA|nr:Thiamine diphosphokinase [Ascochyta rabiei]KZM23768.1 ATP binding [Ascochyta rabiei]UPX10270.1 Thiamine diphosphokinase [Ascochyta rabiei]
MSTPEYCELDPTIFLADGDHPEKAANPPDLLILNQPITDFASFSRLWKHTNYRICADGGANRLHDMFNGKLEKQRAQYVGDQSAFHLHTGHLTLTKLPNIIHGDLDSLRDDVRAYYESHDVEVLRDGDQYSTDFGKTLSKISARHNAASQKDVLILGTLAGRVDQGLGLLHEMMREETKHPNLRLWLFSESSLSMILRSRRTAVRSLLSSGLFTENLGLVPVYGPATISTTGLEWDVKDWFTQMGGQVSTSNHVKADEVQVETDQPILFTIERAPLEQQL